MNKRQVWRYFCEHCGRGSGNASFIARHERHCGLNPNRVCRMCQRVGNTQASMSVLLQAVEWRADDIWEEQTPDRLREVTGNCPACILAALRQAIRTIKPDDCASPNEAGFSWVKEREEWLEDYKYALVPVGFEGDVRFDREVWLERRDERLKAKKGSKTA